MNKIQFLSKGEDKNVREINIFYDSVYTDELEFINSLVSGKVDAFLSKKFDSLSLIRSEQVRCASILLEHFYKLFKVKYLLITNKIASLRDVWKGGMMQYNS